MSKSRRLSERWFTRALWLVALVFAAFLVGLGSLVIGDLPQVDRSPQRDDFIALSAAQPLRDEIASARRSGQTAAGALDQASLKLLAVQKAYDNARDAFGNWIETRKATNLPSQDDELIARTAALDSLKGAQADAQRLVDASNQRALDAQQAEAQAQEKLDALEAEADRRLAAANRSEELRVFGYRLALTLPLLAVAGWLFRSGRRSVWWPFVWGFILFALFAFFVELVPYLPSYGGYVHYGVGLVLTVLVGRGVILALNRYLARQALAEQQPDVLRRNDLDYDAALVRLAKGVCPGCERPVDLKSADIDFCPHCGIGLFKRCSRCATRKSAFAPYCQGCGLPETASSQAAAVPAG